MKSISIVIPALNESDGIASTIKSIPIDELAVMDYSTQIIVVDNDSIDGTGDIAKATGAVVVKEDVKGYGKALRTGFDYATGDIIVTGDADGSYPFGDIPKLVDRMDKENLDFINCSRMNNESKSAMSTLNMLGNFILTITMALLYMLLITDSQSGMWVIRRSILPRLKIKKDDWRFSQEIKIEACHYEHLRWDEVPIKYQARIGKTKMPPWKTGFIDFIHLFAKRIRR